MKNLSWNTKGKLISFDTPKIMGVINLTPDSFYDGGRYKNEKEVLTQVEQMLSEGADFIDVGAYSSRPDATDISVEEELQRISKITELIIKRFDQALLSIDTFRSRVAKECLDIGACWINDISGGSLDPKMMPTVGKYDIPFGIMHMIGTPQTMKKHTQYKDIIREINLYFSEKINQARSFGISDLCIDPGFGFSKTLDQNYEVLNQLKVFELHNIPILSGISRKSMIYKTLDCTAKEALNGTTALNMASLIKGAKILRVHDVKEAWQTIKLYQKLQES